MQVLNIADLYGGKLCAALDRQHPRDLFDVKVLLENEGINEDVRKAFIFYLISNDRPFYEVLNPSLKDVSELYKKEFIGMTTENIPYEDLIKARENCILIIKNTLTLNEKNFLLSFKTGEPDWNLIDIPKLNEFPSIKWKLLNIKKMSLTKREENIKKLKNYFNLE